jgi:phosphate transport system ATP-binding protein
MIIETAHLNLYYGKFQALKDVNLKVKENVITGIIGPSGCGKSTLLRVFNRMNDLIKNVRITGSVMVDTDDIYSPVCDLTMLRKRVGMVFQRPNAFPLSIYDNVAYGPRVWGISDRSACALPGCSRSSRKYCSWMNHVRHSTLLRLQRSKN